MKKTVFKSSRIISAVLSLMLILSAFIPEASAFEPKTSKTGDKTGKIGSCDYTFNEAQGILTVSGTGATPDINGENPWQGLEVKSVVVENGITSIGDRLFSSLYSLKDVTIADSVTEIKSCSFGYNGGLESVKLPASLKTIGEDCFSFCGSLDNVVIPDGCEYILYAAFYGDTALKSVTIPASVKKIHSSAFINTGLMSVTIPGKTTELEDNSIGYTYSDQVFKGVKGFVINCDADSLAKSYYDKLVGSIPPDTDTTWTFDKYTGTLTLSGTGETPRVNYLYPAPWAEHYEDINFLIVNNGIKVLNGIGECPNLRSVTLSDSVEKIGEKAFYADKEENSLSSVQFGKGLKEIGGYAFNGTNIKSLTIPESVETIGEYAFANSSLSKLEIGSGVKKIGAGAFYDTSLISVQIPDNVTEIGKKAFGYYYDERVNSETGNDVSGDYLKRGFEIFAGAGSAGEKYAVDNGIVLVRGAASINKTNASIKAGKKVKLSLENCGVQYWTSTNDKVVYVDNEGNVYGLKKGVAYVSPETPRGLKFKCKVTVTSNPSIKINGKAFNKKKLYYIKKGGKLSVKISGRAAPEYNSYSSTKKKVARVPGSTERNAKKISIKGYKKGKATVTLKINGVKFKVKVKVY